MHIKIVNLNLWNGGLLFGEMVDFLKSEAADIYLLQEVYDGKDKTLPEHCRTFDVLKERLGFEYRHFAPAFIDDIVGREIVQGNAIFSKFPLEEVKVNYFDVPFGKRINDRDHYEFTPRNLQHVTAKAGDIKLHLTNTQGVWGNDGRDTPRRLAMAKSIMDEAGDQVPLLLSGDFNVEADTKAIALIETKLHNVFKNELQTTFNVKRKDIEKFPGFAKSVVDMVFVSPGINVIEHKCRMVDVSDHLPLVAVLEI